MGLLDSSLNCTPDSNIQNTRPTCVIQLGRSFLFFSVIAYVRMYVYMCNTFSYLLLIPSLNIFMKHL